MVQAFHQALQISVFLGTYIWDTTYQGNGIAKKVDKRLQRRHQCKQGLQYWPSQVPKHALGALGHELTVLGCHEPCRLNCLVIHLTGGTSKHSKSCLITPGHAIANLGHMCAIVRKPAVMQV